MASSKIKAYQGLLPSPFEDGSRQLLRGAACRKAAASSSLRQDQGCRQGEHGPQQERKSIVRRPPWTIERKHPWLKQHHHPKSAIACTAAREAKGEVGAKPGPSSHKAPVKRRELPESLRQLDTRSPSAEDQIAGLVHKVGCHCSRAHLSVARTGCEHPAHPSDGI